MQAEATTDSEPLSRRGFLGLTGRGATAAYLGGAGILLAACDPVDLLAPDANGLRLPPLFSSRVIATTGELVPGTGYVWHGWPDGGATFALPDGGWSYVSNSELFNNQGGVGFVRFDANANITDAGSCLTGTIRNCAGGKTPWGTWLSCEEWPTGLVWECDPLGATAAVAHPLMGAFWHEAALADEVNEVVYLTEDWPTGGFYRFVPTTWGDLSAGTLEIMTEDINGALAWATVPDPTGVPIATRDQVADTKPFAGGEGLAMTTGNRVVFSTKGDDRVWIFDPAAMTFEIIYDPAVQVNGILTGVDNVETSAAGVVYVAEDGGDMQIVLVREDGSTFPVVQVMDTPNSEMAGPAFDPSGTRLYFSSQRNPGRTYEVTGPWGAFTEPGPFNAQALPTPSGSR